MKTSFVLVLLLRTSCDQLVKHKEHDAECHCTLSHAPHGHVSTSVRASPPPVALRPLPSRCGVPLPRTATGAPPPPPAAFFRADRGGVTVFIFAVAAVFSTGAFFRGGVLTRPELGDGAGIGCCGTARLLRTGVPLDLVAGGPRDGTGCLALEGRGGEDVAGSLTVPFAAAGGGLVALLGASAAGGLTQHAPPCFLAFALASGLGISGSRSWPLARGPFRPLTAHCSTTGIVNCCIPPPDPPTPQHLPLPAVWSERGEPAARRG